MRLTTWVGSMALATLASVGMAFGQESQGASAGGAQTPEGSITVTGCLKMADVGVTQGADGRGGATGTSGSTAVSNQARGFMLTNANVASSPTNWPRGGASGGGRATSGGGASESSSAAGATRGTGTSTAASAYVLQGSDDELRQHLNQQVQITGQVETESGTVGGGEPASGKSGHATQRLRVASVKLVANACSMR